MKTDVNVPVGEKEPELHEQPAPPEPLRGVLLKAADTLGRFLAVHSCS